MNPAEGAIWNQSVTLARLVVCERAWVRLPLVPPNAPIAEKLGTRLQSEPHQCDSDWVLQKVFDIHNVRTIIINADKTHKVSRLI